jgi:hypothetical protein
MPSKVPIGSVFTVLTRALPATLMSICSSGLFLEYKKQARKNEFMVKNGIQLSKMIVTGSHSERGCHEDIMLLSHEICQHYFLVAVLF